MIVVDRHCKFCGAAVTGKRLYCGRDCQNAACEAAAEAKAPSVAEIQAACEAIKKTWLPWEERERLVYGHQRPVELEPVTVCVR